MSLHPPRNFYAKAQTRARFYGAALISIALANTWVRPARADFYIHAWEDHHEASQVLNIGLLVNDYSTNTNFNLDNTSSAPGQLQNIIKIEPDFDAIYGFDQRLSAFARLTWERLEVQGPPRGGVSYGFADQTLGLNYRLLGISNLPGLQKPSLDIQIQGDIPIYSSTDTGSGPNLGDASTDITIGGFGRLPIIANAESLLTLVSGAGFTYRSASFSQQIPYSIFLEYKPSSEGFVASLGGFGNYSLKNDAFDTVPNNKGRSFASTDGSYLVNAIDPQLASLRASVGYNLNRDFTVLAQAIFPVVGAQAPSGTTYSGGVRIRFGADQKETRRQATKISPEQYGKANQGFVNYGAPAKILRTNDRLNLIKIDKGSQDGVEVGQIYDIFRVKADGSAGEAIARAQVNAVKPNEAALNVTEYFKEVLIDEGFIAKHPLQ